MPAPRIANPFAGQVTIEVLAAIPGARITVFDAAGVEIADGSGDLIATTRPLIEGELLRAVQSTTQCTSLLAYQVQVYASMAYFLPEPSGMVPVAMSILMLAGWAARSRDV